MKLLNILDDTYKKIEWFRVGRKRFYVSNDEEKKNHKIVDSMEKSDINITVIGHTHIDVA